MTIRPKSQEWKNWKCEAATGAFQENRVLQGRSPAQFRARTGENKNTRRQQQGTGDKNGFLQEIRQKPPLNRHPAVKM
jgi:hypothetical protein